jgi:hypothetical protein
MKMERLKNLEDVYQPDERSQNRYDINFSTGEAIPTTVESIYTAVEAIRLNDNVPEIVRSQFNVARNLALYAWFVYSFNEVAAMHAFTVLEMAARIKTDEKKTAFKNLLDKLFPDHQLAPGEGIGKAIAVLAPRRADP